jgi:hypothetical protein
MPLHVVSGTRSQVYLCYIILHPALCRRRRGGVSCSLWMEKMCHLERPCFTHRKQRMLEPVGWDPCEAMGHLPSPNFMCLHFGVNLLFTCLCKRCLKLELRGLLQRKGIRPALVKKVCGTCIPHTSNVCPTGGTVRRSRHFGRWNSVVALGNLSL